MDSKVLDHFGLESDPFGSEPDPRRFHPTRSHSSAAEELGDRVRRGTPLTVLQGAQGSGKTTVLYLLADDLPDRFELVVVGRESRRLGGLWTAVARELGLPALREGENREAVQRHIAERGERGDLTGIAIDDAHTLPDHWVAALDEMTSSEKLTLVLACAGSPAGTSRIPAAERVRSRVVGTVRLRPILESESSGYLQALLMAAGAREARLFDDESVATLHELSGGLPGRLAAIAARAMTLSYGSRRDGVVEEAILTAAEELSVEAPTPTLRSVKASAEEPSVPEPAAEIAEFPLECPRAEPSERDRSREMESIELHQERPAAVAGGGRQSFTNSHSAYADTHGPSRWPTGKGADGLAIRSQAPSGPFAPATESVAEPRHRPTRGSAPAPPTGTDGEASPMHVPAGVDADVRREILAGARRPDRPAWDRSKTDPYRVAGPAEAPFGPEMLPVIADPHGDAAEWFRNVRMGLEEWMDVRGEAAHSVMVSSAEAKAGKTFVAVNLALLFANEPGHRVLIVDGDLRRPRFEALFGLPARPGLADVIAGRAEISEAMQYVSEVGLYVLPAGRAGNPRDLVSPERLAPVLEEAKAHVDLIILDSPPMQGGVDARGMAASVDGVLFAARSGHTRAPELVRAMRALDRKNLIGAVVTGVQGQRAEHGRGDRSRWN